MSRKNSDQNGWTNEADMDLPPSAFDATQWHIIIDYPDGYQNFHFDTEAEARSKAAELLHTVPADMVNLLSPADIAAAQQEEEAQRSPGIIDRVKQIVTPASLLDVNAKYNLKNPGVLVGTSGFKYKHWFGTFYPADLHGRDCLAYYATKFPTVEASATFHQMPEPRVITRWRDSVPSGFVFSLRGPKEATHIRHLAGCGPIMSAFCRRAEILGDKLGPITFQLMESERFDPKALEAFVSSLPTGFRYSIEFRSEPWHNDDCYGILARKNIASVIVGHSNMGIHTTATADWSHIRMSGHHPDYAKNSYSNEQLMNWRGIIADSKRPSYVYFNNEFKAYAADNALSLMSLMGLQYQPVESAKSIFPVPEKRREKKEVSPKKLNLEPSSPSANPAEQNGEVRPDKMMTDPYQNNDDRYRGTYPKSDW